MKEYKDSAEQFSMPKINSFYDSLSSSIVVVTLNTKRVIFDYIFTIDWRFESVHV